MDLLNALGEHRPAPKVKALYKEALKCIDSCRTSDDLEFLASCIDWDKLTAETPKELGGWSLGESFGCTDTQLRDGIANKKYKGIQTGADGKCFSALKSAHAKVEPIAMDFALLLDNSGSMADAAKSIVPKVVKQLIEKSERFNLDTNLILLTQNLDTAPIKVNILDPDFKSKITKYVQAIYRTHGDGVEKPAEALLKHLPGLVRPTAHLRTLILTDEVDSSQAEPSDVLGRLRALTEKDLLVYATDATDPEPDIQALFRDIVSSCFDDHDLRIPDKIAEILDDPRLTTKDLCKEMNVKGSFFSDLFDDKNMDQPISDNLRQNVKKLRQYIAQLVEKRNTYLNTLASATGGAQIPLSVEAISKRFDSILSPAQTHLPIEPDSRPETLVVRLDGELQPFENFDIDLKKRSLVFKSSIDRSKPHALDYEYLVDPKYFPKKSSINAQAFAQQMAAGKRSAEADAPCLSGKDLSALIDLKSFASLNALLPWITQLSAPDVDEFYRTLGPKTLSVLSRLGTDNSADAKLFASGVSLLSRYQKAGKNCALGRSLEKEEAQWVEQANARITSGEAPEYAHALERARNYLESLSFTMAYGCRKKQ